MVCRETGFSNVGIISTYTSERKAMRKRSNGFIYHLRWDKPNTPTKSKVWAVLKTCSKCSRTLTSENRKTSFRIDEDFDLDLLQFHSINQASRVTGLSYCALRNACEKRNMTIMRQKDGEIFRLCWSGVCVYCVRWELPFPVERKFSLLKYHKTHPIMLKAVHCLGVKVTQYWFLR